MKSGDFLIGLVLFIIGLGLCYYYYAESNRISNKYFEKGYEAGRSGDDDSVPDLVEEETNERESIVPFCYSGLGFLFFGSIVSIYGLFAKNEKEKENKQKVYHTTCSDCGQKNGFTDLNRDIFCQGCGKQLRWKK